MKSVLAALAMLIVLFVGSADAQKPQESGTNSIHLLAVAANQSNDGDIHDFDKYAKKVRRTWAKHHSKGGFQGKSLLGEKATRDNVLKEVRLLAEQSGSETLSAIYFDMHGGPGPNGLLMATAGRVSLNAEDLRKELPKFKGNVLVILDTCHAGTFLTHKELDLPNVAVIAACGSDQLAYGRLPQTLAEALSGKADFNHDGVISLGEVARYIKVNHKKPKVQPVVQIPSSMRNLPLAKR